MENEKCIVLLSGGQDSTTCLYWAKSKFAEIHCVAFDYGQTHARELVQAAMIAKDAGAIFQEINIKGLLSGSSLTDNSDHNEPSPINEKLPNSFTAGRNILFLSIVASIAATQGAKNIVIGVCQTDYNGYPDCRDETMQAMENVIELGYGVGYISIHTPMMFLTKAETWKMAKDLGCVDVIINDTITDYNASMEKNEWGYGTLDNGASKERAKGYYEAKEKGWI